MSERSHVRPAPAAVPPAPRPRPQPELSGGRPLDTTTCARMSARFGHDFSRIRIHTDTRAEESAAALGANAFAAGDDIAFGAGRYAPGSPATERLLAHELTHVVQRAQGGPGDPARRSDRDDASEREASALSGLAAAGQRVSVRAAPGAAIARDELPEGGAPLQAGAMPPNINPFGPTSYPPPVVDPVGPTQFPVGDPLNPTIPKAPPVPNIPEPPPGGFPKLPPSPASPLTPATPPAGGGGFWDTLLGAGSAIGGLFDFFPPILKGVLPGDNVPEA